MAAPEGYKALGKIGISYKGDYNPNTVYERLDAVYHNGSTYLAIKDAPDGAPRNDKINWIYLAKGYDGETVDVAESEIVFTESETRENIGSGEKVSTVFGKIKKFFTDLTAPAFAQMITTKEDLLATKVTGYVPDAKAVADGFADVNGKLSLLQHYKVIEGTNTGNTLTFTLASVSGWSSKLYLVINFDCRSTYSVDLTGIYLVKYHANTANIGTVTIKEISGKIPNCAIVNNQIILTYTADQNIVGSNKIICIGT